MPECRACKARIEFLPSIEKQQLIPIDPDPNPNGNLIVIVKDGKKFLAPYVPKELAADDDGVASGPEDNPYPLRYISHFATCTDPRQFRKPK